MKNALQLWFNDTTSHVQEHAQTIINNSYTDANTAKIVACTILAVALALGIGFAIWEAFKWASKNKEKLRQEYEVIINKLKNNNFANEIEKISLINRQNEIERKLKIK